MDTLLTIQQVADQTGVSEHIGLIESINRADNKSSCITRYWSSVASREATR